MDLSRPASGLLGESTERVLRRLSLVDASLTGRRLAALADVPPSTAQRVLNELVHIGLVLSADVGKAKTYRLNRAHVLWPPIEQLFAAPLQVERVAREVAEKHVGDRGSVALYGSVARGDATAASDIDILIVWGDSLSDSDRENAYAEIAQVIGDATGNRVEIVDLTERELGDLVRSRDPLIDSLRRDAKTVAGIDLKRRLQEAAA